MLEKFRQTTILLEVVGLYRVDSPNLACCDRVGNGGVIPIFAAMLTENVLSCIGESKPARLYDSIFG